MRMATYPTTRAMRVTCEKTQVKTFHDTQRHEMHLLRGGGSSRSKRRVDILPHLNFTFVLVTRVASAFYRFYCFVFYLMPRKCGEAQNTLCASGTHLHIGNLDKAGEKSLQASKQYRVYSDFLFSFCVLFVLFPPLTFT